MKEQKYYLVFDEIERGIILQLAYKKSFETT